MQNQSIVDKNTKGEYEIYRSLTTVMLACFFYIVGFLGHRLEELQGIVNRPTLRKLQAYEAHAREAFGLSALDTLFLLHQRDKTITELAEMLHISSYTLRAIFDKVGLPRLSSVAATRRYLRLLPPDEIKRRVNRLNADLNSRRKLNREWMRKHNASLSPEQRKAISRKAGLASIAHTTHQQRSEWGEKAWSSLTFEQRSEKMRKRRLAIPLKRRRELMRLAQAALTPAKRIEMARGLNASLTVEQKRARAIKAKQLAEIRPNGIEKVVITMLKELGIYAERAETAQKGQVYYTEHRRENKRYIKLRDGRTAFPDFKVKGYRRIIEVFGEYWHSQTVIEAKGEPAYKWNAQKMIEEYAAVGYEALVIWEKDLKNPQLTDAIKKALSYFSIGNRAYHGLLKAA